MTYNFITNTKCLEGVKKYKWTQLGRTMASQCSVGIDELGRLFTWGQNISGESGQGDPTPNSALDYIELATQLMPTKTWVKSSSGEDTTIALNTLGELWGWGDGYYECSPFGLPPGSGTGPWSSRFYTPVLCTPGYLWKDFAHDYYHTIAIGQNDKLYTWGYNGDYALGMAEDIVAEGANYATPILNTYLTDDIKLLDCEGLNNVAVTVDDKVYIWGEWFWDYYGYPNLETPREITGIVIPDGETIVDAGVDSYYGVYALLSNGELWGAGHSYMYADGGIIGNSITFQQIPFCIGRNIVKVRWTSLGCASMFAIDSDGNIWGWSDEDDWYTGNTLVPVANTFGLVGAEFEDERFFIDVINNGHNRVIQAIDNHGYLWTWGSQVWGPHLAIGAAYSQALANQDPNVTEVVALRELADYALDAVLCNGDPALLNVFLSGESDYIQPLPQLLRHRPCGHWHLREFPAPISDQPKNCWMPALAVDDGILLFAAAGRYAKELTGSGNEILMFTYNIAANTWTRVVYEEGYQAAFRPGGAAIDSDIYVFANWKQDQVGSRYNEVYTNEGIGVWVYNVNTGVLNYTQFLDSAPMMFMKNKTTAYAGGVVAIAYTDNVGQLLVRVSTDYGVTWNLRKTVGALAARVDFSLSIDKDTGYMFLVHQVSATSVMVERSVDNGVTWTTRIASNYLMANLTEVKLNIDTSTLFLFGASGTATAIEISTNEGTSWTTQYGEPGASIVGSGTGINDDHSDKAIALVDGTTVHYNVFDVLGNLVASYTTYGTVWNYLWDTDYGGYNWLERAVDMLNFEGYNLVASVSQYDASLNGDSGIFAYSAFKFYTGVALHLAVMISVDSGVTWHTRETPLAYYEDGEFTEFMGCPLFCLTDVPHLNHIWTFEKSDWNTTFVKQKDKYKVERPCVCPLGNRCE